MTHQHTFRLFAIYFAGSLIISESPVSAFTISRARTTTLRTSYDLTGEGSALLGVRNDLPKRNNVKGIPSPFRSNTERQAPVRTSANVLNGDRKLNRNNNAVVSSKIRSLNTNESSTGHIQVDDVNTVSTSDSKRRTPNLYALQTKKRVGEQGKTSPAYNDEPTVNYTNENINISRKRHKSRLNSEQMTGDASSIATIKPPWKTYTRIERKPTTTVHLKTELTDHGDELEKSETVTTKISLEAANVTSVSPLDELQTDTHPKIQVTRDIASSSPHIEKDESILNKINKDEDRLPEFSTSTAKTTANTQQYMTSKRAGFLDASVKKTVTEPTTPEYYTEKQLTKLERNEQNVRKNNNFVATPQRLLINNKEEASLNEGKNSMKLLQDKNDTASDNSLSVKPISSKGALYTVNPNYRKMKKIEVQPLKPFVRDPDDNSWRNESLSLLGIVFKAKNASKPFTQVLKNKTEAELSNLSEKDDKNEVTDLRERLEKIAEVRKSRKKKVNKFGDTVYSDYEEVTSSEGTSKPKIYTITEIVSATQGHVSVSTSPSITVDQSTTLKSVLKNDTATTKKPNKLNKFLEYYDTTDEYDADYILQPKLDLKKFTTRFQNRETTHTPSSPLTTFATKTTSVYNFPDRKPTVQYFPPLPPNQKASVKENTDFFQKKVNFNEFAVQPVDFTRLASSTRPTTQHTLPIQQQSVPAPVSPTELSRPNPSDINNAYYITHPPRIAEPSNRHTTNDDETYNRASYVIKHFKDLIDEAVRHDYDKSEYVPSFTAPPLTGVTVNEAAKSAKPVYEPDYVANIRSDILNKFVDNFNQNSERFKVDFPILYNNSVIHRTSDESGRVVASSTAFLKGLYETPLQNAYLPKPCEPNCDMKLELSPSYELHYYVPEQEEKEVLEPKPATLPYTYRYPLL